MPKKQSKRYRKAAESVDSEQKHALAEAVSKLSAMPQAKFDETVELSAFLGVDPKQSDQMIRGTVKLPHGSGKKVRVLAFTENPEAAKEAGADFAGLEDMLAKVEGGWLDFDVAVSTTTAMKDVRKLARVLGPRGMMPNPKSGTVTDDIAAAINEVKAGRVEFKMDKTANVAIVVGKRSFSEEQLNGNVTEVLNTLSSLKPESIKGTYIKKLSLSSSMSPSVALNVKEVVSA